MISFGFIFGILYIYIILYISKFLLFAIRFWVPSLIKIFMRCISWELLNSIISCLSHFQAPESILS